jgi:hypothetical protein
MTEFPTRPPDINEDPRYEVADHVWWVVGINFQFAFFDRHEAEQYKASADGYYGLGDVCSLTRSPGCTPFRSTP